MSTTLRSTRWYTVGGLLAIGLLLLGVNAVADRLLSGMRIDLTSNKLYTLSDGTREVLANIEEPLNLYYFYSREAGNAVPQISSHARRVRELLDEFSAAAGNKLRISSIDPEPFSDAEDRAVELGVEPVPLDAAGVRPGQAGVQPGESEKTDRRTDDGPAARRRHDSTDAPAAAAMVHPPAYRRAVRPAERGDRRHGNPG